MIPAIEELNFPKIDGKQYATLSHATVNLADMGEKTISTQIKIDGDIVPDFSQDWEVAFQGEKYIMPLRLPQGAKENTSLNSTIDLTFQHWAIWQLKRWTFVTMQPINTGTAVSDEEVASVQLNLKDFCDLFGQVLRYYYGDTITIDLNPAWQYDNAPTAIEISHSYIWNVLIDAFHDKYGVRWAIEPREDNDNTVKGGERYVIKIGYPTTEVDHIFEYGFEGGLLKLERQVQSEDIRNMIKGRGGDTNIPFRYFKDTDPNNKDFATDPDWVEELKNIYFTNLMPATYRSYIQGWKAAHISKYPGYKAVGENNAYSPWAYRKGFTDTKFHPVEFVADEITINPQEGDRQVQIYPDYAPFVKKGSSIDVYGPLLAPLDNNDDIYPTIQGTGLDIAVDVEQIESDDVAESVESDAQIEDTTFPDIIKENVAQEYATVADASKRRYFSVPTGKAANIEGHVGVSAYNPQNHKDKSTFVVVRDHTIKVYNAVTGAELSASGIPAGNWYFTVEYDINNTSGEALNVTCSFNGVKITSATPEDKWQNTFDIWVKNIWNTQKGVDEDGNVIKETDAQYAERVWRPILGDREGNTAKVVFTSGMLLHEDYEFRIVDFPVPDTSKTYTDANGVKHDSHWRIKLAKSDAELEATGLYVPSTQKQGRKGDTFAFIGTEMTHVPYVVDAEIRLDDWKKDHLGEVKEIKPTFVVTTDRVRLNNEGKPDALINQLRVGNSLRIADKRFIQPMGDRAYETLYLQSLTYTYREPTPEDAALNPDVEIVLSNEYTTSANPVSVMQGEISSMQRLLGSISNVEQIVRAVGDKLYLRKDGISDRSLSPTQFFSLLTSGDFRAGLVGGAGWGFFKDENGNWVLEADRVNVRQEMQVNTLVINQAEGRGGMEIDTAAFMEVTRVEDADNGFVCYFDQKKGSVANLFHVDDVAYCNRWTPENQELKFYKRRVVAVGVDSITLTKEREETDRPSDWPDTGVNGTGIPAEKDNIIHFGNYKDKRRQYVKVRDVVGGGYERYIEELNSVNAAGVEYHFVGKQAGKSRWFVGNKDLVPYSGKGDGSYIEYKDGKFNLNNVRLSVGSTIGNETIGEYIKEEVDDFVSGLELGGTNLLLGTQDWSGDQWGQLPALTEGNVSVWAGTVAIKNNQTFGPLQAYTSALVGEQYTFSFWIKISDGVSSITLTFSGAVDTNPIQLIDKVVPGQWIRLHATFTAANKNNTPLLRFQRSPTSEIWLSGYKLERGNMPTDWSKNPADNDTAKFNYLLAAMKDGNTLITNALVQTSVVALGKFDEDGKGEIWAGTNGLYKDSNTPAIWAGGDMEDAEYSNADRTAKFLVRMDGTGYAAGNTVKFNQSQLKVGDKTIMDKDGFAFVIPSETQGEPDTEILRIANMEIGDLNSYLSPVVGTINVGPFSKALTLASGTDGFTVSGVFQYNISHSMFKAGATLNMSVQVLMFLSNVDFNVPTDPWAVYRKPVLHLRIMDNTTRLPIFEDSQVVEPVQSDMSYFFNINTVLPTTGTYTLIVSFSNGTPPTSAASYGTSMSVTIVGNSYVSSGQRVLIAPNGVAIAKENTLIFSNENEVVLRAGKFVFRIDNANGFSYSSNGGAANSWRPIGWT